MEAMSSCPRGAVVSHCAAVRLACVAARPPAVWSSTPGPGGLSVHAMQVNKVHIQILISRANIEGSTVSFLICDRWLMLGLRRSVLVAD